MNFFKILSISRFVISLYGLQVSRSLKTCKIIKSGLQCTTFLSQILFTSECTHYSRVLFFTVMSTCTTQQKIHFEVFRCYLKSLTTNKCMKYHITCNKLVQKSKKIHSIKDKPFFLFARFLFLFVLFFLTGKKISPRCAMRLLFPQRRLRTAAGKI